MWSINDMLRELVKVAGRSNSEYGPIRSIVSINDRKYGPVLKVTTQESILRVRIVDEEIEIKSSCNHTYLATSKYGRYLCYGAVCTKCGDLSCICNKGSHKRLFARDENGELIGDRYYEIFHGEVESSTGVTDGDNNERSSHI